ncbi:hypothetical protein M3Y97_00068500 [Aphelenchoides bicaudatus]|nr:hypothetical protein M3Y97_00068500 [Aphelenchoides bicaudatus]
MTFGKVGMPSNSSAAFMLSNPFNIAANGAQIQTNPLRPFVNFSGFNQSPSVLNPLLNMATIRQQSEQFVAPGTGHLMHSHENLNLLNALLKQSASNGANAQRISTLLTEQQVREAEAHRLQFLDFNSLHTNTLAGPSTLLPNSNITHQSNNILNSSINYAHNIPKLPPNNVFNMVENTLTEKSTNNAASTSNQTDSQLGILPYQPYYPTHFMRGTVIQTATDTKKLVEDVARRRFPKLKGYC